MAIVACLAATLLYGYGANFAKKRLAGVSSMAMAAGSQLSAALLLAVPAWLQRPQAMPGATAWISLALLALLCTGVAYILYFRLIAHIGATSASAVTFLIPAFAAAFGWLLLDERLSASMIVGGVVILMGTALAMGLWPRCEPRPTDSGLTQRLQGLFEVGDQVVGGLQPDREAHQVAVGAG